MSGRPFVLGYRPAVTGEGGAGVKLVFVSAELPGGRWEVVMAEDEILDHLEALARNLDRARQHLGLDPLEKGDPPGAPPTPRKH